MRKVLILVKVFFFFWGWKYDHGCYVVEPSRILDFLHFFYILTCIFVNIHGAACCIYLKFVTWHSVRWTYWDIIASVLYCNFAPVKEETNPPKVKIYIIIKLTWSVSCNISSRAMWKHKVPHPVLTWFHVNFTSLCSSPNVYDLHSFLTFSPQVCPNHLLHPLK